MHDIGLDEYLKGFQEVLEIIESFFLREAAFALDFLLQCPAIAVFIDEVVVVSCFEYFDEANDVCCIFDLGKSLDFIDSELLQFGTHLELLNLDDLDGHSLRGLLVDRFVNFTELSLPYNVIKDVVLDLFAHAVC